MKNNLKLYNLISWIILFIFFTLLSDIPIINLFQKKKKIKIKIKQNSNSNFIIITLTKRGEKRIKQTKGKESEIRSIMDKISTH